MRIFIFGLLLVFAPFACEEETLSANSSDASQVDERLIKSVLRAHPQLKEDEVRDYYQKCADEGGKGIIGGFGQMACEKTNPDAGKSCTQNSDCSGFCLAETKTCAPISPLFGCTPVLPSPGQKAIICVD